MNEVLVVRHGEAQWNLTGRRQGLLDSPLTAKGRADARALAGADVMSGVDAVHTSPLGRARATAEIIALELGLDVVVLDELHEIDHGDFAGLTNAEIEERRPGELARRRENLYTWRFPNGESYEDGSVRARAALEHIAVGSSQRALVVTHEMIGRMILGELLHLTPQDALRRSIAHRVVVRVNVDQRTSEEHRLDGSP